MTGLQPLRTLSGDEAEVPLDCRVAASIAVDVQPGRSGLCSVRADLSARTAEDENHDEQPKPPPRQGAGR